VEKWMLIFPLTETHGPHTWAKFWSLELKWGKGEISGKKSPSFRVARGAQCSPTSCVT